MFSAHSCHKNWENQAWAGHGGPAPPGGGCWAGPWRPGPYLPSLGLLRWPAAAIRAARGAILASFSPADGGSDMKPLAAAGFLSALFHFLSPRANHTTHSLTGAERAAESKTERVREKHVVKTRGEKRSEGKDLARKREEEKTRRERARGKDLAKTRGEKRARETT